MIKVLVVSSRYEAGVSSVVIEFNSEDEAKEAMSRIVSQKCYVSIDVVKLNGEKI